MNYNLISIVSYHEEFWDKVDLGLLRMATFNRMYHPLFRIRLLPDTEDHSRPADVIGYDRAPLYAYVSVSVML